MSNENQLYGENKIITEEATVGGLLMSAVAGSVASLFVGADTLRSFVAHKFPSLSQGVSQQAWGWYTNHYSLSMVAIAAAAGLLAIGFAAGFSFFGFQRSRWHFNGMEFITDPKKAIARMQKNEFDLMSARQRKKEVRGINIAGVELSRTREVGHISIVGLPGGGKTVIINNVVYQILERDERIILHDPKGDFTSWLFDDKNTVLLGPWDARARCWDIAADIDTAELATSFADALVKGTGDGANSGDSFFDDSAVVVIGGLIKGYMIDYGQNWSWDTLASDLTEGPRKLLISASRGDPLVRQSCPDIDQEELNKTTQSIIATVSKSVSWILAYAGTFKVIRDSKGELDREASRMFAIKKWLAKESNPEVTKVVFNNDKNYETRSRQIFGAMMSAAANHINSSKMPEVSADAKGLWVVLDEYPQLGKSVAQFVQQIEELGRSRGVRVLKAVQDESQLFAAVGREKGEAQKSVQQTRIYCKMATGTASELSKKLGDHQYVRIEFPQVIGAGNKRIVQDREPVIRVDELTGLRILKEPAPLGVELVIHSDDVLVKLVQPFISGDKVKEICPKVIPNKRFEIAALNYARQANGMDIVEVEDPKKEDPPQPAAPVATSGASSSDDKPAAKPTPTVADVLIPAVIAAPAAAAIVSAYDDLFEDPEPETEPQPAAPVALLAPDFDPTPEPETPEVETTPDLGEEPDFSEVEPEFPDDDDYLV